MSTPHISTLFRVNSFPSSRELLYKKQYLLGKEKYAPILFSEIGAYYLKCDDNNKINGFFMEKIFFFSFKPFY
ncbi:hypothetical protein HW35_16390 [Bacillus sp. X1(2014)]|nr:hypothetical protein HW35_16390 [Bacillus sp. X1(2014)]